MRVDAGGNTWQDPHPQPTAHRQQASSTFPRLVCSLSITCPQATRDTQNQNGLLSTTRDWPPRRWAKMWHPSRIRKPPKVTHISKKVMLKHQMTSESIRYLNKIKLVWLASPMKPGCIIHPIPPFSPQGFEIVGLNPISHHPLINNFLAPSRPMFSHCGIQNHWKKMCAVNC